MGTGKGLLDSLIAEGGVKSRDLRWVYIWAWLLKLRGVGVIGMQLNFMAIHFTYFAPTSLIRLWTAACSRYHSSIHL